MNLSDPEAERCLLASVLLDRGAWCEAGGAVNDSMFYSERHALLWRTISSLYAQGLDPHLVALRAVLEREPGALEKAGGPEYLIQLGETVPTASNAAFYATRVADAAVRRWYFAAFAKLQRAAQDSSSTVDDIEAAVSAALEDIAGRRPSKVRSFVDLVGGAFNDLLSGKLFEPKGLATGIYQLDAVLNGGFQPGQLILLAARPSVGKSSLATNIAARIGCVDRKRVALFSLEVGGEEVAKALIACRARVCTFHLRKGQVSEDEKQRLVDVAGELSGAPIDVDDNGSHTIHSIASTCRAMHSQGPPLALIVIDYLGLVNPGKECENRQNEVAFVSRQCKALAKELKVPVLALAQLNREVEKRASGRPTLADLRDSGALEQDADVVLMLARSGEGENTKHTLTVAKNRHGAAGVDIDMHFEKIYLRWTQGDADGTANDVDGEAEAGEGDPGRGRADPRCGKD